MEQRPLSGDRLAVLETMIDVAGLGTWLWNVQTGETEFNENWARMLGYTLAELEPTCIQTWLSVLYDADRPVSEKALRAHFEGRASAYDCEVRVHHRDGHLVWIRDFGRVISWTAEGYPEWVSGAQLDITSQKHTEQSLRAECAANQELVRTLEKAQEIGNLGYWKANLETGDLYWSSKVFEIFGVCQDTFEPSVDAFKAFVHPEDLGKVEASDERAKQTGLHDVEHRIIRPDGAVRWVHERADYTPSGDDQLLIGTVRDITEQKQQEARLRRMSITDPLTQIHNRRVFMERLRESYELFHRKRIPAAVIMLDIDHFKLVNDTYGHSIGDWVLKSVACTLAGSVRESDLACRLGGEEFGLLLPGTSRSEALELADRLRAEVARQPYARTETGDAFHITLTAGVSVLSENDQSPEQVLKRADAALYCGKNEGRNRVEMPS